MIYDELVEYAVEGLKLDPKNISPESNFETLGVDSLDVAEMIAAIEENHNIELDLENQNITNFKELADFIQSKLN